MSTHCHYRELQEMSLKCKKIQNPRHHGYHNYLEIGVVLPDRALPASIMVLTMDHPVLSNLLNQLKPGRKNCRWCI